MYFQGTDFFSKRDKQGKLCCEQENLLEDASDVKLTGNVEYCGRGVQSISIISSPSIR